MTDSTYALRTVSLAKANWDADRRWLRAEAPEWEMPAWSRAPAWRRRPYIAAATASLHQSDLLSQSSDLVEKVKSGMAADD